MSRSQYIKERRAEKQRLGICTECENSPKPGSSKCSSCIRKNVEASVRYRKTLRGRFSHFKVVSKLRHISVHLDFHEFSELATASCSYCGAESKIQFGSGIDRQDHYQSYTPKNSVPCCRKCNIKKGLLERMGFKYPRTVELLKELLHESLRVTYHRPAR